MTLYPGEKRDNLKNMLHRWKEKGWVYTLKKGLYEMNYPDDPGIPDMRIANVLYSPSYVSLETALSHYNIIPEVAVSVTSVTTKPTRTFRNRHGLFTYHTVRPGAFAGYYVMKERKFDILIAEPEKALVDYLHFADVRNERIDKKVVSKLNRGKIMRYAALYKMDWGKIYADL